MKRYQTLYEQAIGLVDNEVDTITYHLASNSAKDIEEYRRLCGVVQGLTLAKDILKDLQKRQENDADE